MASFELNHLFKGPVSKYSHVLMCWELESQPQYEIWGNTNQPITPLFCSSESGFLYVFQTHPCLCAQTLQST